MRDAAYITITVGGHDEQLWARCRVSRLRAHALLHRGGAGESLPRCGDDPVCSEGCGQPSATLIVSSGRPASSASFRRAPTASALHPPSRGPRTAIEIATPSRRSRALPASGFASCVTDGGSLPAARPRRPGGWLFVRLSENPTASRETSTLVWRLATHTGGRLFSAAVSVLRDPSACFRTGCPSSSLQPGGAFRPRFRRAWESAQKWRPVVPARVPRRPCRRGSTPPRFSGR